jgi:hypothetical protein
MNFKCVECGCTNYHEISNNRVKCNICKLEQNSTETNVFSADDNASSVLANLMVYCRDFGIPLKIQTQSGCSFHYNIFTTDFYYQDLICRYKMRYALPYMVFNYVVLPREEFNSVQIG